MALKYEQAMQFNFFLNCPLLFQFQPSFSYLGMSAFQRIIKKTVTYLINELTTTVFAPHHAGSAK